MAATFEIPTASPFLEDKPANDTFEIDPNVFEEPPDDSKDGV